MQKNLGIQNFMAREYRLQVWGVIVRFCNKKKLILFREREQIYSEFLVIEKRKKEERRRKKESA